ncbi:DUF943 family protein [Pantoea sp. App145]|uniref:DUF943 family protein n=1 Tax=Pantoea sp. App145 TaxID=3071567 RepID=UPI003A802C15
MLMNSKKKKTLLCTALLFCVYKFVQPFFLTPVIIDSFYVEGVLRIIIKNPPPTAKTFVSWWMKNKDSTLKKHATSEIKQLRYIVFIDYGEGFVELPGTENFFTGASDNDYFCFDEIKNKKNCLYRDFPLRIHIEKQQYRIIYQGDKNYLIDLKSEKIERDDK